MVSGSSFVPSDCSRDSQCAQVVRHDKRGENDAEALTLPAEIKRVERRLRQEVVACGDRSRLLEFVTKGKDLLDFPFCMAAAPSYSSFKFEDFASVRSETGAIFDETACINQSQPAVESQVETGIEYLRGQECADRTLLKKTENGISQEVLVEDERKVLPLAAITASKSHWASPNTVADMEQTMVAVVVEDCSLARFVNAIGGGNARECPGIGNCGIESPSKLAFNISSRNGSLETPYEEVGIESAGFNEFHQSQPVRIMCAKANPGETLPSSSISVEELPPFRAEDGLKRSASVVTQGGDGGICTERGGNGFDEVNVPVAREVIYSGADIACKKRHPKTDVSYPGSSTPIDNNEVSSDILKSCLGAGATGDVHGVLQDKATATVIPVMVQVQLDNTLGLKSIPLDTKVIISSEVGHQSELVCMAGGRSSVDKVPGPLIGAGCRSLDSAAEAASAICLAPIPSVSVPAVIAVSPGRCRSTTLGGSSVPKAVIPWYKENHPGILAEAGSRKTEMAAAAKKVHEACILEEAEAIKAATKKNLEWARKRTAIVVSRCLCLWDYMLEEMAWMAVDFAQERMWKVAAAAQVARWAVVKPSAVVVKRQGADRARRIASLVQAFWSEVRGQMGEEEQVAPVAAVDVERTGPLCGIGLVGGEIEDASNRVASKLAQSGRPAKNKNKGTDAQTVHMAAITEKGGERTQQKQKMAVFTYGIRFAETWKTEANADWKACEEEGPGTPERTTEALPRDSCRSNHFVQDTLFYAAPQGAAPPGALGIYLSTASAAAATGMQEPRPFCLVEASRPTFTKEDSIIHAALATSCVEPALEQTTGAFVGRRSADTLLGSRVSRKKRNAREGKFMRDVQFLKSAERSTREPLEAVATAAAAPFLPFQTMVEAEGPAMGSLEEDELAVVVAGEGNLPAENASALPPTPPAVYCHAKAMGGVMKKQRTSAPRMPRISHAPVRASAPCNTEASEEPEEEEVRESVSDRDTPAAAAAEEGGGGGVRPLAHKGKKRSSRDASRSTCGVAVPCLGPERVTSSASLGIISTKVTSKRSLKIWEQDHVATRNEQPEPQGYDLPAQRSEEAGASRQPSKKHKHALPHGQAHLQRNSLRVQLVHRRDEGRPVAFFADGPPVEHPVGTDTQLESYPLKLRKTEKSGKEKRVSSVQDAMAWSEVEDQALLGAMHDLGTNWLLISDVLSSGISFKGIHRRPLQCQLRYRQLAQDALADSEKAMASARMAKQQAWEEDMLRCHQKELVKIIKRNSLTKLVKEGVRHQHPSHGATLAQVLASFSGSLPTPLNLCEQPAGPVAAEIQYWSPQPQQQQQLLQPQGLSLEAGVFHARPASAAHSSVAAYRQPLSARAVATAAQKPVDDVLRRDAQSRQVPVAGHGSSSPATNHGHRLNATSINVSNGDIAIAHGEAAAEPGGGQSKSMVLAHSQRLPGHALGGPPGQTVTAANIMACHVNRTAGSTGSRGAAQAEGAVVAGSRPGGRLHSVGGLLHDRRVAHDSIAMNQVCIQTGTISIW
eukprot:jgi/Mesen1/2576/ME000162S01705